MMLLSPAAYEARELYSHLQLLDGQTGIAPASLHWERSALLLSYGPLVKPTGTTKGAILLNSA